MLKPQLNDVTCSSYSFLVSTSTQSWRSEGPQGSALGDTIFGSNGKKNISRNVVFPCFSRDFTGETFDFQRCLSLLKFVYVFCFIFCFKTDGWDSKKMEEAKVRRFSSKNIRQLRLKRSTTAWTLRIGEWSGATEKKRCNCRIGMIQLNPIWSSPIETLSSFLQCTVTNETLLHAEINNVLMTHPVWNFATWHLPSTELQTALCKEGNEQRRFDKCLYRSQIISKVWVPINVEP